MGFAKCFKRSTHGIGFTQALAENGVDKADGPTNIATVGERNSFVDSSMARDAIQPEDLVEAQTEQRLHK